MASVYLFWIIDFINGMGHSVEVVVMTDVAFQVIKNI